MRTILRVVSCLLIALLPSCNFAPYNCPPSWPTPCSWRVDLDDASVVANLFWWQQFADPVLDELICEALTHNRDLATAVANVNEYYARLGVATAPLFPTINHSNSVVRQEISLNSLPSVPGTSAPVSATQFPRLFSTYTVGMQASYEVDLWGKLRNARCAALHSVLSREEAQRDVLLTLITSVANAYIQLRVYDAQLHIASETVKSRKQSLDLAKIRFQEGLTSELPVRQAEADLDTAEVQELQLRIFMEKQENMLAVLIGHNPEPICRGEPLENLLPPCIPDVLPCEVIVQRPDILQVEQQLYAANAQIGAARAAFFPQVNLAAMLGVVSVDAGNLFSDESRAWSITSSLLGPIFQGGKLYYQARTAYWQKQQLVYTYQKAIQNALREVNDAMIAHRVNLQLAEVQRDQVRALTDYLHLATLLYENGQTDYLTVLDAERLLFNAQLSYAQVQGNVLITVVDIYRALGGGWEVAACE